MKKITLFLTLLLFVISGILAQTPEMFKYQAVLRNVDGNIMAGEIVTVDISILKSDLSTSVFDESHAGITTTAQGLIALNIGSVNTTDLALIDWTADEYFIEISVNGTIMGTSQLLSVPYALQAKEVENIDYNQISNIPAIPGDISDLTDNSGMLFDGDYNSLSNLPALFDGEWSSLLNTPTTVSGYGITDAFDGDYNSLSNLPTLFDGNWTSLTGTVPNVSTFTNDAGYLSSHLWSENASDIYFNTGNVGIGTDTPLDKLSVAGNVRAQRFTDADNTDYWVDPSGSGSDQNNGARFADGIRTDVNTTRTTANGGSSYPLIIRHFVTTSSTAGVVIAQTPEWELRRNGTVNQFQLYSKNANQTAYWARYGNTLVQGDNPGVGGSITIDVGTNHNCEIWFGYPFSSSGHFCYIQIFRKSDDYYWNGMITTTYSDN